MTTSLYALTPEDYEHLRADIKTWGFTTFGPDAVADDVFTALVAEAADCRPTGWERSSSSEHVWRADLGPLGRALVTAPETLALVREIVGYEVTPSFAATCFTYYEEPEHFLGVHKDRAATCAVTLILYLVASWPESEGPSAGLQLVVFPHDGDSQPPTLRVTARANRAVIGLGAEFPHARPPLQPREQVHALTACFAAVQEAPLSETNPLAFAARVPSEREVMRAQQQVDSGFIAWQEDRFDAACVCFESALAIDRENDQAWAGLGHARWSRGEFESAREAFSEAARRDAYNAAHWSNIGLCLRDLGHYEEAENVFAVSLLLDPEYAPALNEWGNVRQDQGQYENALAYYYRSLALDPTRAVVHHNLGVAYARLGHADWAFDAFAAALERDPQYAPSLEELGVVYAAAGFSAQALAAWQRAGTPRAETLRAALEAGAQRD